MSLASSLRPLAGALSRTLAAGWERAWPVASIILLVPLALMARADPHEPFTASALLPALALHYWTVRDGRSPWITVAGFGAGLAVDLLSQGPLGLWALIDLAAIEFAAIVRPYLAQRLVSHAAALLACLAAVAVVSFVLTAAVAMKAPDLAAFAEAFAIAAVVYPGIAVFLHLTSLPPLAARPSRLGARS